MEIIVGRTAGFCFGVSNAVNEANKLLEANKKIYCLGELVHNKQVSKDLENKGLIEINNIEDAENSVIIRTHGVTKKIYNKANQMGLNVIDLTCPKVLRIHKLAEEYAKDGYYIILIGHSAHPETIGTISFCGDNYGIVEDDIEIYNELKKFYKTNIKKLLILEQTTFSLEKFEKIKTIIENEVKNKCIELEIKRTICDATRLRQEETEKISSTVDFMIIIGGKHSSNTNKLYEIAKRNCKNSVLVETKNEINLQEVKKYNKIGIMAGASTPQKSIDELVEILSKIC